MTESFEITLLTWLFFLVSGVISFKYTEQFLQAKFERRLISLLIWLAIYVVAQILISETMDKFFPYNSFINIIPNFILMLALQAAFFERNFPKQIFIVSSYIAGLEILRFLVSPLAYIIYTLWSPFYTWFVSDWLINNFTIDEFAIELINYSNRVINFTVILFCRLVQILFLAIYLKLISKEFVRHDYELRPAESIFLTFPCVTVIVIDFTFRLMAISVNNGAVNLIYRRVPETVIMLPIVTILLLGIVIISVKLFKNLVMFKDEEQKRILLENRVAGVHHEVEELTNIYSDIRGLRHDLRNHIANIAAYIRQNSDDNELNKYLNQMTRTVEKLDFTYKTGNPIIDIILHQSLQRARKNNIRFVANFHYPKGFGIDVYDLSIILNNALQNALEACEKFNSECVIRNSESIDRFIEIQSYIKGNFYFMEIVNDFDGKIIWNGELPTTSKSDKQFHGIGLSNIQRCAQKYNGDLNIETTANKFKLTIMLTNCADHTKSS